MNLAQPPVIPTPVRRQLSLFLKIAGICFLILALHIPLLMTNGVLQERRKYQQQAIDEIAGVWGRSQLVTGPVLAVPYTVKNQVTRAKGFDVRGGPVVETELTAQVAYFLPESLTVAGTVEPELRHRGIYDAVVYSTKLNLTGWFQPDFAAANIAAEQIQWDKARVLFGVTDLHGVRAVGPFKSAGGREATFESTAGTAESFLPLAAKVTGAADQAKLEFNLTAVLQGSERLEIAPLGKATAVTLQSPWPDPSFMGALLPVARRVGADGFKAEWESAHFSRGFPQAWTNRALADADMAKNIAVTAFGVRFAQPVDSYSMAERAQKYGVLFFVLVFAVFFLFEVTSAGLKIHPLQYAMVGAALALFFLLFLALSEFWATGLAYGVAAAACTGLVSAYAWSFLKTGARTLVIGGGLAATYGYLYFVLKSQDYALVAGTAALFAALALVMFCTRRINWYSLEMNPAAAGAAESR
ncbi:MAG: cell envelope integrity protein CreD [Lacunisphaera sp.]|nr:cell envelope integrity protein CreD [Lacunisphaera sp.]